MDKSSDTSLLPSLFRRGMGISLERAFDRNLLMSVTIGNNVTSIGFRAFAGNNKLTSVILSKSLYDILNATKNFDNVFGS